MFFVAGGIIIVGGYGDNDIMSSTEGLGMQAPPSLPEARANFPLVLVGRTLYMCGGCCLWNADCYTLDTKEANPTWKQATALPRARDIYSHSGVAMGAHIWYVHDSTLYDYDTINGTTEQHDMPFNEAWNHCAVANETHSYVAGVGYNNDEIWVNAFAGDPSQWTKVTKLPNSMFHASCVWFQGKIHMQGRNGRSYALDVKSHNLQRLADMKIARWNAGAAVLDCKPAVIGGWERGGKQLSSIETYNGSWTLHEMSLETARSAFGLVQFNN